MQWHRLHPLGMALKTSTILVLKVIIMLMTMFQLSWTSLCGAEIQVTHDGSIISPHYPKAYARNLNCNYTIIAPGKLIYGEFKDFEVEEGLEGNN